MTQVELVLDFCLFVFHSSSFLLLSGKTDEQVGFLVQPIKDVLVDVRLHQMGPGQPIVAHIRDICKSVVLNGEQQFSPTDTVKDVFLPTIHEILEMEGCYTEAGLGSSEI